MKIFLRLLAAECRRMTKELPKIAAKTLILVFLLGIAAVCALQAGGGSSRVSPFSIGYTLEEGDRLGSFAVFYLEHLESMSGICRFVPVTEEEGRRQLERGELSAYIHFPEQFIEKILDGTNEPVQIQVPENRTVEAALFQDTAKAGADMLSVAQAEIYASYSLAMTYGQPKLIPQMQEDINRWNLKLALNRNDMFHTQVLSATGQATAVEYGAASLLVLCLFLFGIPCSSFLVPSSPVLNGMLRRAGVTVWQQIFARLFVMTSTLVLFTMFLMAGMNLGSQYGLPLDISREAGAWMGVWCGCLCIASIQIFCCQISPRESTASLMIFWVSVILILISGGFLPSVFLPETVQSAAGYLPGTWLLQEMSALFTWNYSIENHQVLLGFTILFFFLSAISASIPSYGRRNGNCSLGLRIYCAGRIITWKSKQKSHHRR